MNSFYAALMTLLGLLRNEVIGENVHLIFANISDTEVNYVKKSVIADLDPGVNTEVEIPTIPAFGEFVVFQVHTQFDGVVLKGDKDEVVGKNIGLVKILNNTDLVRFKIYNPASSRVKALIAAVIYGTSAPIPGGCNLVFSAEISPFLKLELQNGMTAVQYQPSGSVVTSCDILAYLSGIEYYVYVQYLDSDDFLELSYFNAIDNFITVGSIAVHGEMVGKMPLHSPPEKFFPTYPGIAAVYVIVAKHSEISNGWAAYVPVATYACTVSLEFSQCEDSSSHFEWLVLFLCFFFGGMLVIAGHRLYRIQQFIMGFIASVLVSYIIMIRHDPDMEIVDHNSVIAIAIGAGLAGGIFWLFFGMIFHWPLVTVSLPGFLVGFLYGCVLFYTPLVRFDIFQSQLAYWGVFCTITFIFYFLMVPWLKEFSIFCCVQIGLFAIMLAVDFLTKGTIKYILINVFRRATNDKFVNVSMIVPYQISDWITISVAIILLLVCYNLQKRMEKKRIPFPPPVKVSCFRAPEGATETTPLLD